MEHKYYEAYDDRYRQVHSQNLQWFYDDPTPIVMETIHKFNIRQDQTILELGCGEGRDAHPLLNQGHSLLATDISSAAIGYAQKKWPEFASHFSVLDCIDCEMEEKYDFIYAIAVIHMLVEDSDRDLFYTFIQEHLNPNGIALICSMGDGKTERQTDIRTAFNLQIRVHEQTGKEVQIASTSCRMVSFETLRAELKRSSLEILEEGITAAHPDFPELMYVIVRNQINID